MALTDLLALLFLSCILPVARSQQQRGGSVSLWSDSECNSYGTTLHFSEPDPIVLNFALDPDTCGVPSATVHSYKVKTFAVCANGTEADFSYYNSANCTKPPTDENPPSRRGLVERDGMGRRQLGSPGFGNGRTPVDTCLALVAFNSFVFKCEGVSRPVKYTSVSGSQPATTSSATSTTPFSTPTSRSTISSSAQPPSSTQPLSSSLLPPPSSTGSLNSTSNLNSSSQASASPPSPTSAPFEGGAARVSAWLGSGFLGLMLLFGGLATR